MNPIFVRWGTAAVVLTALLGTGASVGSAQSSVLTLSVPGIPGPYCAYGLEKRLLELPDVQRVELLWRDEQIRITVRETSQMTRAHIQAAIARADYPYPYRITP